MLRAAIAFATVWVLPGPAWADGDYGYGPQPPKGPILDLRPFLGGEKIDPPARQRGPAHPPAVAAPRAHAASAGDGRFVIQVGAFGEREAALKLRARLEEVGRAWLEPIDAPGGRLHRVRFGAFASREAAQSQADRLLSARLVDAAVVVSLN